MQYDNMINKLRSNPYKYRLRKVVTNDGTDKVEKSYFVVMKEGKIFHQKELSKNVFCRIDKKLFKLTYNDKDVDIDTYIPTDLPNFFTVVYDYTYDTENEVYETIYEERYKSDNKNINIIY